MKLTGHKTTCIFDRYNTIDQDDAEEAVKRLDEYIDLKVDVITSTPLQTPVK
jgi:hypothetical protein